MTDQDRLAGYVEVWWEAINDFVALLEDLEYDEWSTPTDLAGWDVRAVASHIAHLEAILAGGPEESAEVGEPAHVSTPMGLYTEIGVVNRRNVEPGVLIAEIRDAVTARYERLRSDPPTDGRAKPADVFGGVPWSWETLLRNRPLDVWMHEQDVRRATDRPGGMDSPAARHTTGYLIESFGYVLAKRVGAGAGTCAVLAVAGSDPVAFTVTDAGRGEALDGVPEDPTVTLAMDRETFICLAGGRRAPASGAVTVTGDAPLGERILATMATTP